MEVRSKKYNFKEIEDKWQRHWEETGLHRAPEHPDPDNKFYMLVMFAYPSGDIHMGHFRNYIIGDAVARRQMMLGKSVLHPFGWDAFGLPAERAAIQRNIHPEEWTLNNIAVSRRTLSREWAYRLTGPAKSLRAFRITINGRSGCSSSCSKRDWPTANAVS